MIPSISHPSLDSQACRQPIFGHTPTVIRTAGTLLRLQQMDALLPAEDHQKRQPILEAIEKIWKNALQHLDTSSSPIAVKEQIRKGFSELGGTWGKLIGGFAGTRVGNAAAENVYTLCKSELENAQTILDLQRCVLRFLKDTKSLRIHPLQKSHCGVNGPTLLVSYPRNNNELTESYEFTDSQLNTFVVKWTTRNEFLTTKIYSHFSRYCAFLVPQASCIDLAEKTHIMIDGFMNDLSSEMADCLKNSFLAIAKTFNSELEPKHEQILLLERLPGDNLFDFARRKYPDLSLEQRAKLFNQLGQLAIVDLLVGNQDRFIKADFDNQKNKYQISNASISNLGNAMVTWHGNIDLQTEATPQVYAIDNGIGTGLDNEALIHDKNGKTEYIAFLTELFTNPKREELLVTAMAESLKSAFKAKADDECKKDSKDDRLDIILKQIKPCIDDLDSTWCREAFRRGMQEISDTFLPAWESHEIEVLRNQLSGYPELLESVTKRVEIFKLLSAK
jgi:hypothetical protein